ncbi:MAG: ABC transporter permease, partial [Gemmatimonadota bacterium]
MKRRRDVPRLLRLALRTFPAEFRAAFAEEMEEDYREARVACRTRWGVLRLTVRTVVDVVVSGRRERRARASRSWVEVPSNGSRRSSGMAGRLWRDLRFAVRALARRPGFALVAILTLALGIGANTAVFSVVNAVLLRPLKWADPDGLVHVWAADAESPEAHGVMSLPDVQDIAELPALESMVGYRGLTATVTGGEEPELVEASRSTDGLMSMFRVQPYLGRDLTVEDARIGGPAVVVVGYRYWRERLGARAGVIGTTLEISEVPYEIVGVAPPGFDFPDGSQLWWPRWLDTRACGRGCHTLYAIGRLAPGVTLEEFGTQLTTLAARLSTTYPETNTDKRFRGIRLADDAVADVRLGLWLMLGAVALVLLIACANVANLLLVRGEGRRAEVAVRAALGASRGRIVQQVLLESGVLTAGGVLAGLALAWLGLGLVRGMPADTVPRIEAVSLDGHVLAFTLGTALVVMLLFGLSPALRLARGLSAADLASARRGGPGPGSTRLRSLLLAVQVALSVTLLAGAGLLLKSFDRLYSVELGFDTDDVARFRLALPRTRYDSIARIVSFYSTLEDRLRALPGVVAVGSVFGPPLGVGHITGDVRKEGEPPPPPGAETYASMHSITPGYPETMGLPLVRGRAIEDSDRAGTLPVAVVSRTFVRQNFPGEDPLGKRFEVGADFNFGAPLWTIVGVVDDVRRSPTAAPEPDVYVPLGQYGPGGLTVTMRTAPGSLPSASSIREIVRSMDAGLPVIGLETVRSALRVFVARPRFYLLTMATFAGLAVVLACVGLYGVVAYVVSRRGREIGIRMALGARGGQVVGLVLRQGLLPAAAGMVAGLLLAIAFGRIVESLLFEVSPRDPLIMVGVAVMLGAVTFAAALVPAARASSVDPAETLRVEG